MSMKWDQSALLSWIRRRQRQTDLSRHWCSTGARFMSRTAQPSRPRPDDWSPFEFEVTRRWSRDAKLRGEFKDGARHHLLSR